MFGFVTLSVCLITPLEGSILSYIPVIGKIIEGVFHTPSIQTTPEIIQGHGYPVEVHEVVTSDGYILQLHRIPGRRRESGSQGPVALLQHGVACDSAIFALAGPKSGLAYLLADRGYDVWLGNNRGNLYSRKHVTLSPDADDGKFWQFSWHEMGLYDLPAEIDYILNTTHQRDLFYIGHSQGTTQFFVMGSERPEYNAKIARMFALAPVAFMSHARTPVFTDPLYLTTILKSFAGHYELFSPRNVIVNNLKKTCFIKLHVASKLCSDILFLGAGFHRDQMDLAMIPEIFSHLPSSYSVLQMNHYEQLYESGSFRQFDYGSDGNLAKYGSVIPPEYKLERISAPVALYYSQNDLFAAVEDVDKLYAQLGNPIGKFLLKPPGFNHLDFMWAKDVKSLLYDDLMHRMDAMSTQQE